MKLAGFERLVLWIGCVVSAAICLTLTYQDRVAAATVAGGLTAILLVFLYLPLMDSFEVFGLKAKLRERLAEAEELMRLLRQSAMTTSKLSLHQLAYANRMASMSWDVKKQFVKEVEETLAPHQVPSHELIAMKEPLLRFLTRDLLAIAFQIVSTRVARRRQALDAEIAQIFPGAIDPNDERFIALNERRAALVEPVDRLGDLLLTPELKQPRKIMFDMLEHSGLPDEDKQSMGRFLDEVSALGEEIWSTHNLTNGALKYLNEYPEYNGWQRRYEIVFGERP